MEDAHFAALPSQDNLMIDATLNGSGPSALVRSDEQLPVFQLSSYRTGSTWLWLKMREQRRTLAYYEIFHENLSSLTVEKAKEVSYDIWPSRHPPMNAYFLEFVPLIGASGGVVGYDTEAVRTGFIPQGGPDGDLSPAEKAYIDRLVADARSKRKLPFLSCTGSVGRARALRKAYGAKSILLHRNLFHQFMSFCSIVDAGVNFFDLVLQPFRTTHDPFLRDIAIWFGLDKTAEPARDVLLPAFILQHLYLYAIAYDHVDVVVGMTEIAIDKTARGQAERSLSNLVGCEVDLSDVKKEGEPRVLLDAPPILRDTVEQFAKLIPGNLMSAEASLFVERTCQSALAEWERYDFYTRHIRTVLVGKIANAEAQLAAASATVAETKEANDGLLGELSTLRRESAQQGDTVSALADEDRRLRDALGAAVVEGDASRQRASTAEHELAEARAQMDAITAERDSALANVARTEAEQATLRDDLASAACDRDALQHALEEARSRGIISFLERIRNRLPTRSRNP